MYRDPRDIVPFNPEQEILLAIFDELVAIRTALASAPDQGLALAIADALPEPEQPFVAPAVKKPAAKKPAVRKTARKKRA